MLRKNRVNDNEKLQVMEQKVWKIYALMLLYFCKKCDREENKMEKQTAGREKIHI